MSTAKRILLVSSLVFSSVLGSLFAQERPPIEHRTGPVTAPVDEVFDRSNKASSDLTRITFYRTANSLGTGATGIEINGQYHTSLQKGSFSQLCLAGANGVALGARLIDIDKPFKNYVEATSTLKLKDAQEAYVRVSDKGNGRASIEVVDARTASQELRDTRRQSHAVSRVTQAVSCQTGQGVVETISFGADALFKFGKSDLSSILPEGRASLVKLITGLKNRYGNVAQAQIRIVGYADPLGSSAANLRLSAERAQTIEDYLVNGGFDRSKITSEGRGESSPEISNCPSVATPESIACNKPNRRVVVSVSVPNPTTK